MGSIIIHSPGLHYKIPSYLLKYCVNDEDRQKVRGLAKLQICTTHTVHSVAVAWPEGRGLRAGWRWAKYEGGMGPSAIVLMIIIKFKKTRNKSKKKKPNYHHQLMKEREFWHYF